MTFKHTPETQFVKAVYKRSRDVPGDQVAGLAEFNRWYKRELALARAEGKAEGLDEGRCEQQAIHAREAATEAPETPRQVGYVVFNAPHELWHDLGAVTERLQQLAEEDQVYATMVEVTVVGAGALGYQIKAPIIDVPHQVESIV